MIARHSAFGPKNITSVRTEFRGVTSDASTAGNTAKLEASDARAGDA
jgi:hypothetical protein